MSASTLSARDSSQPTGERLRIRETGAGDPLLFLHGFEGQPDDIRFFDAIGGKHRIIAPDHPGFDESDDNHSIEEITDLALLYRNVIEREAGRQVDLVGHSMGAMIAAEVAALSPHLVRRLVLINPFGLWVDEAPTADLFVMTPGELRRATWTTPPESANGAAKSAPPDKAAMIRRYRNFGAASRYLWPIPDRGFKKRARYVTTPTLAIFGAADGLVPASYAAAWSAALPNARTEVIEGGHMLPFEYPDVLARLVGAFLEE